MHRTSSRLVVNGLKLNGNLNVDTDTLPCICLPSAVLPLLCVLEALPHLPTTFGLRDVHKLTNAATKLETAPVLFQCLEAAPFI